MRRAILLSALAGALVGLGAPPWNPQAQAAEDQAPPRGRAGPAALVARVLEVVGTVETRPAVGRPWRKVAAGDRLAEGADLRTGFRARCVLDLYDSLVQVDPLTVVRLAELKATRPDRVRTRPDRVRTRLHLKQGHAQAAVEKGRIQSDFTIVTPSAVLSVRGTRGIRCGYFPDTGGTYGLAERGLIAVRDRTTGRLTPVQPGQDTDDRATLALERLAMRRAPKTLDQAGHDAAEKRSLLLRHHGTPPLILPALKGPDRGLPNRRVQDRAGTTRTSLVNYLRIITVGD